MQKYISEADDRIEKEWPSDGAESSGGSSAS